MKVILDTNIYISGLIFPDSNPDKILKYAQQGKIKVYCSPFILEEIKKVLVIKFGYSEKMAEKFIEEILKFVEIIKPKIKLSMIKEKDDDNRILEAAVTAKADFLISGDKKHILPLKKFKGIKIVKPAEFLEKFN